MRALHRFAPLAFLALAGCSGTGDYPSLAPRAVERLSMEEPVRTDPPVAADAALRSRASGLLVEARRGDAAFEAAYGRALPRVRAAGSADSEGWIEAQEAISRVETARVGTISAVADLDALLAGRAEQPTNAADQAAIAEALAAAQRIAADQNRRLAALRGSVSSR